MAINFKSIVASSVLCMTTACASMSNQESSERPSTEREMQAFEDAPMGLRAATESLALPHPVEKNQEVRVLDAVLGTERKMRREGSEKRKSATTQLGTIDDSTGGSSTKSHSPPPPSAAPERAKLEEVARGAQSECDEVLGGDYWAERLRIEPSLQRFFQANSSRPFELSVYRRVTSSPEEFIRVFEMDDPALRVSFVIETPMERREESDFIYEIQLLNRSSNSAEYCLKHWR